MNLKLTILNLSEKLKWKNWPTWLKGFFLLWPSLGPAYLFIARTPVLVSGDAELGTIMSNIEYLNYFIAVFIGFWSLNLILLGLTWTIGSLTSDMYRSYLRERSRTKVVETDQDFTVDVKELVKKYPVLVKKSSAEASSEKPKTIKKKYPILKKKTTL